MITRPMDDERFWDRRTLISRAATLDKNDVLAGGIVAELVTSVVGTGLALHPEPNRKLLGWSQDQMAEWAQGTKERFELYASNPNEVDIERRRNFYQMQPLALRTVAVRGDAFCVMPRRRNPGGIWALKLQLLEGDRILTPRNLTENDLLSQGVEVDAYGAPLNYWISQKYPSLLGLEATDCRKVAAFDVKGRPNVLHLMRELRPGQRRGLPYLAPVISTLKQISRLGESELAASVVSSLFAVLIKKSGGMGSGPLGPAKTDTNGNSFSELQPGMIAELNQGEDISIVNPTRPNGAYDPFFRALVGQISLRIQVPPEVLFKKFESSYTAARGALLQFWKFIMTERELFLAPKLCQPVYEAWLEEDVAAGRTIAPGFLQDPLLRAAYCGAKWVGDSAPILDPLKEVLAAAEAINATLTTYSESTLRVNGGDFEANVERLQREERLRKEAGLTQEPVIKTPPSGKGIENAPVDPNQGDPARPAKPNGAWRAALLNLAMKEST
jgi:lambda family phage portal protein